MSDQVMLKTSLGIWALGPVVAPRRRERLL